jgi:hypothetical protein
MRKIVSLFIIIVSSIVLLLAMNQGLINRIKQDRYFDHLTPENQKPKSLYYRLFVKSDRWGNGDLYGICYLPQYRIKLDSFKAYHNRLINAKATNRVLYIIGDSFTADKKLGDAFPDFDNVIFLDRRFPFGPIQVDTAKQNYLVMEFSELNISDYSSKKSFEVLKPSEVATFKPAPLFNRLGNILFNKELNKNIELLLFDNKAFTPLKQFKAAFNYHVLGRLPREVAVSTDKKRLLLNSTVDISSATSVFKPMTDSAVDRIVNDLAADQKRYIALGFKKVFLSLIPNAVSVYDQQRLPYNHLVERIENKTGIPAIPVYRIFKNDNRNLYSRSDAHWNPIGFEIWVNETNKAIKSGLH